MLTESNGGQEGKGAGADMDTIAFGQLEGGKQGSASSPDLEELDLKSHH